MKTYPLYNEDYRLTEAKYPNAVSEIMELEAIARNLNWLIGRRISKIISLEEMSTETQRLAVEINHVNKRVTGEYPTLPKCVEYTLGICFEYHN